MTNSTESSTVLLLCLEPAGPHQSLNPSLSTLKELFSPFGYVKKLMIFSRKRAVKAFVEFEDLFSAERALKDLGGKDLGCFGRARLFFSALQELENSNGHIEFWDSSVPEEIGAKLDQFALKAHRFGPEKRELSPSSHRTASSLATPMDSPLTQRLTSMPRIANFQKDKQKFVSSPQNCLCLNPLSLSSNFRETPRIDFLPKLSFSPYQPDLNQHLLDFSEDASEPVTNYSEFSSPLARTSLMPGSPIQPFSSAERFQPSFSADSSPQYISQRTSRNFSHYISQNDYRNSSQVGSSSELEQPRVVLLSNVGEEFGCARDLFNLMASFGFVAKLLFMRNLRKALVEFASNSAALASISAINFASFSSIKLRATLSKHRSLDLRRNNRSQNSQVFNEAIIGSQSSNRVLPKDLEASKIFRCLLAECDTTYSSVKPSDIFEAISRVSRPSKPPRILSSLDTDSSLLAVVFEFDEVDQAAEVLAKLHGSLVKNTLLSLSFYQS